MNRRLYALHRFVSLAALIQLALWMMSGFFFAVVPIERVRGKPVEGAHAAALQPGAFRNPNDVLQQHASRGRIEKLELIATPGGVFYRGQAGSTRFRLDAQTGTERPVTEDEARAIASRDQPFSPRVLSATRIDRAPDVEYRSRPLPAWKVVLDDGSHTAVYVDAQTGDVTARRSDLWRVYDFLWSLHIMDYRERESFNHPLLVGAAAVGLATVTTGAVLWILRVRRRLRRSPARLQRGGGSF